MGTPVGTWLSKTSSTNHQKRAESLLGCWRSWLVANRDAMKFGLLELVVCPLLVVAGVLSAHAQPTQQNEQEATSGPQTGCKISIEEMESFQRTRRLAKYCK